MASQPVDPKPRHIVPPAFNDDEDEGEGSEWGWSDWDGVDWEELRWQLGGPAT